MTMKDQACRLPRAQTHGTLASALKSFQLFNQDSIQKPKLQLQDAADTVTPPVEMEDAPEDKDPQQPKKSSGEDEKAKDPSLENRSVSQDPKKVITRVNERRCYSSDVGPGDANRQRAEAWGWRQMVIDSFD